MCLVPFFGSLTTYGTKDKCSIESNIVSPNAEVRNLGSHLVSYFEFEIPICFPNATELSALFVILCIEFD